ncbi:MAG: MmcQ/YjbR family DNA-binding protein [Bacteroidia bacterium]
MDIESLRTYCLAKPGTSEGLPFDEDTLVFKVMGKLFAPTSLSDPRTVNLKCDPERAIELRTDYPDDILPGYHMHKKYWSTVSLTLGDSLLRTLIDHSYDQVFAGLKKADRDQLRDNA